MAHETRKIQMNRVFAGAAMALLVSAGALAASIKPAIIYATGGKHDKSFSEAMWNGAERFKAETHIAYVDFEISNETQFEQAYRHFAQHGFDPILGVGFSQADAVKKVAHDFPKLRFTLIDSDIKLPNVQAVQFREQEGAFVVGVLAAMASKSHKVGFVGGMDIPLIRRFSCGYAQGVKYADPKASVTSNMIGTTPDAWTNPGRAAELAKGQFDRGVDVVFAAAGQSGLGALQAAADAHKLSIGVDSNQDYLHPGSMLTSMVKRVDVVAHDALKAAAAGNWKAGASVLGLKEGGVDYAYDQYNKTLITPAMKAKADQAKADIISGKITVQDYERTGSCNI
jgi:basic membrane protein A